MIPLETWFAFVVKGSLVLGAGGAAAWWLRRSSAAVRHVVWAAALASLAVLPLATMLLPRMTVSVPSWERDTADSALSHAVATGAVRLPPPATSRATARLASPVLLAADARSSRALMPLSTLIVWAWLVGVAAWSVRTLGGLVVLGRLRASARPLDTPVWRARARRAATEMGISAVGVYASDRISVPVTFGVVRPIIVLPDDADSWDAERARVVLLHELAHVGRRDCLIHLVAQCALALHWMNPLAWLAAARLRIERERACDDLVLACGTNGPQYAEHLLDIARMASRRPMASAALAMAHPSELEGRLLAVLDRTVPRSATGTRAVLVAMLLAGSAVSVMAAVTVEQSTQAPTPVAPTPAPTPTPTPSPQPHAAPAAGVPEGVRGGVTGGVIAGKPGPNHQAAPVVVGRNGDDQATPPVRQDVVQALVGAMKDEDPEVRQQAVHALMQVRSPAIVAPMIAALSDSDADVRQSAAMAVGQMGERQAIPALSRLLSDSDADVRQQGAFALGQLGAKEAGPALIKALSDTDADVRQQAAFALGQIGDDAAVEALTKALKDPSADVRQQAACALGRVIAPKDRDEDGGTSKDDRNDKLRQ